MNYCTDLLLNACDLQYNTAACWLVIMVSIVNIVQSSAVDITN